MYVKVYEYYIQEEKVAEYFRIQEKAGNIYKKYIDSETTFLQSKEDLTKWLEITTYKSEQDYQQNIGMINNHPDIQALFKEFQSLLSHKNNDIREEDYIEVNYKR